MARQNTSRQKILDAAAEVFAKNGYWASSMDTVAAAAGVAKGTLYYNFPNKTELFVSVIEDGIAYMRSRWEAELDADTPVRELSLSLIKLHADIFIDYGEIAGIFFNDSFNGLDEPVLVRIHDIREQYLGYIEEALREGMKWGALREIDTGYTAHALLSSIYTACRRYRETGDARDRSFIYTFLQSLIIEGIGRGGGQ